MGVTRARPILDTTDGQTGVGPPRTRPRSLSAALAAVLITFAAAGLLLLRGPTDRADVIAARSDADRQVLSAQKGGLRITLSAPREVGAGELFQVNISAEDDSGVIREQNVRFGDERPEHYGTDLVCGPAPATPEPPSRKEKSLGHAYRAAGVYRLSGSASSGDRCTMDPEFRGERNFEYVKVEGDIRVVGATTRTNGPQPPEAFIGHEYYINGDPTTLVVDAGGTDPDGFVHRFELDWGDGSEAYVGTRPLTDCEHDPTRWPDGWYTKTPKHRYAHDGRYTLHIIVTSVGCDGRDEQTDTTTYDVTYPPKQGS
jgi:hypothetical protein